MVDFLAQFLDFSGIIRVCHALGECGQFFPGQLAFACQFHGESYHPGLFAGSQPLDFFNDAGRYHVKTIPNLGWYSTVLPGPDLRWDMATWKADPCQAARQMLRAWRPAFVHPGTGRRMALEVLSALKEESA
jgi:hypothetical protein